MPHKNLLAGCCYLCSAYVAANKGELLKNRVQGHKYSIRCTACGLSAEKLTAAPTEASVNENAARLVRQAERDAINRLLEDEDMPAEKVRPAQAWLEGAQHPIEELHRVKKLLIELRNQTRDKRLALAA